MNVATIRFLKSKINGICTIKKKALKSATQRQSTDI